MRKRLLSPGNPLDQLLIIPLGKRPGIILPVRSKVPVAGAMPGEIGQKKDPRPEWRGAETGGRPGSRPVRPLSRRHFPDHFTNSNDLGWLAPRSDSAQY